MGDEANLNTDPTKTSGDQKGNLTPPAPQTPPEPPKTDEKTFSQTEVTKLMTREKNQGKTAALRELGIDPKDTAAIDEIKKFLQSKKPEAQVLAEQQIEHAKKIDEANQRAFLAEVKAEIMQAGIQHSCLDDAVALITAKRTDETFELSAAIETLKTKYPVWFNGEQPEKQTQGLKGTGTPPKPGSSNAPPQQDDLGKRLAEQRKSGAVQSKHWGS